ncbi:MAG: ATP-binding cassette domain-containing protein [Actinomycetota bacterium]|nr:ATP-binding cassette domain-containing protein [Actinomycetota bacterium]
MNVIEVHRLTKRFGEVLAVDNLSFSLSQGSVTGFLGPNGAGKTTTLRMLLGLVAPTEGTATIRGRPYRSLADPIRHVGAALETSSFHPGRRARDHLRVIATAAGVPEPRVDAVLAEVGLTDAAHRKVRGFSLGMRQRLALAVALLGEPSVLVLDEPANGLDPEGVHWLRSFLRSYASAGGTVLVSSHLLSEVALTVDEVVVISQGRLVAHSSLDDLAQRATPGVRIRTPQPQALQGALRAKGIAAELNGIDGVVALDTTTDTVGLVAAGAEVVIYEMSVKRFDLEEMFLELTGARIGGER